MSTTQLSGTKTSIDLDKLLKLKVEGWSNYAIADKLGCNEKTVRRLLAKMGGMDIAERKAFQNHKAEVLESLQFRLVTSISDEDIKRMSTKDRIVGIGILHDKIRLERNQSTANHAVGVLSRAIRDATVNG